MQVAVGTGTPPQATEHQEYARMAPRMNMTVQPGSSNTCTWDSYQGERQEAGPLPRALEGLPVLHGLSCYDAQHAELHYQYWSNGTSVASTSAAAAATSSAALLLFWPQQQQQQHQALSGEH